MVLNKLQVGITVYDVRPTTGLQKFNGMWSVYPVIIKEIDIENERVYASWNMNNPEWYGKYTWSKWRMNRPKD